MFLPLDLEKELEFCRIYVYDVNVEIDYCRSCARIWSQCIRIFECNESRLEI